MSYFSVVLLGVALSMDAAAVSMTNGLSECKMPKKKAFFIALVFALFQGAMPALAFFSGSIFTSFFVRFTPYFSLILLSAIGAKMIFDAVKKDEALCNVCLTKKMLLMQAVATSLDALAIGLLFVGVQTQKVMLYFLTIAAITFLVCFMSVNVGKKFGCYLSNKAQLTGGIILIVIGVKIFADYLITVL